MTHPDYNDPAADFSFSNHGSICLLGANSEAAAEWVDENLPPDAANWCGSTVIEPRFAPAILEAIEKAGMTID